MTNHRSATGLPLGEPLRGWTARPTPPTTTLRGRSCRVEPLDPAAHGAALHEGFGERGGEADWTYLGYGPFERRADFERWLDGVANDADLSFRAIVDHASERAVGVAALMRIDAANGVVEVGHVHLAPRAQRTTLATEAMWLLMRHVFDELGYRRYEWKCDSLNARSRRAAERLGFTFEGIFRQALVCKARNRDTAWYSIVDREWPAIRAAHEDWFAPENVDADGLQRRSLGELIEASRARLPPR